MRNASGGVDTTVHAPALGFGACPAGRLRPILETIADESRRSRHEGRHLERDRLRGHRACAHTGPAPGGGGGGGHGPERGRQAPGGGVPAPGAPGAHSDAGDHGERRPGLLRPAPQGQRGGVCSLPGGGGEGGGHQRGLPAEERLRIRAVVRPPPLPGVPGGGGVRSDGAAPCGGGAGAARRQPGLLPDERGARAGAGREGGHR